MRVLSVPGGVCSECQSGAISLTQNIFSLLPALPHDPLAFLPSTSFIRHQTNGPPTHVLWTSQNFISSFS